MQCYRYTNQWDRLPAVLDRLEPNIQDPRWQHKIILHRAVQAVGLDWSNIEAAKRELKHLPPFYETEDTDILTFCLDICNDDLSLTEQLDRIDRITELTDDAGIAFSYRALKGVYLMLLGEIHDAEHQLTHALKNCAQQLYHAFPSLWRTD